MGDRSAEQRRSALIVDDDDGVRFVLEKAVSAAGLDVVAVASIEAARAVLPTRRWVATFVDIRLPDGSGLDLLPEFARATPRPLVVVLTAQDTVENTIEAMRRGADEYLVKPFAVADVQQLARNALERARVETAAPVEAEAPYGLVGRSVAMRDVYKRIGRAAATDLPILIEGETGTGKELVARALHAASPRASGPFVAVNLAAIPAELVESELYGHERGAFTGAANARVGLFEAANGGTLLLDEVGELPIELQPKLLRALQEGEIARLGASRATRIDVRVVAATNVDLARAVAHGRFRADLYYRLRVLPIRLPPLRDRAGDVTVLARHFLTREGPRLRGAKVKLAPEALALLENRTWPGNVRELENVLRAAIVESADTTIRVADLEQLAPADAAGSADWQSLFRAHVRAKLGSDAAHQSLVEEAERVVLREALQRTDGNQVKAAALLGMHRNSLKRRMDELGITPDA